MLTAEPFTPLSNRFMHKKYLYHYDHDIDYHDYHHQHQHHNQHHHHSRNHHNHISHPQPHHNHNYWTIETLLRLMALTWKITSLRINFLFPLSDVLHLHESLHRSRCFGYTLRFQSSPKNKQCRNHLNFATSDYLCHFGDNRSLDKLWLLNFFSSVHQCVLSQCT